MVSLTLAVSDELKKDLAFFSWINWSEIAREEAMKKLILAEYLKTGTVSDEDWLFCDRIDWHPVDELPLKKEFIQKIQRLKKEKTIKINSLKDLFL